MREGTVSMGCDEKKNKQSKKEFLEIKNMKWNKNSVAVLEEIAKESSPKANKE